MSFDPPATPPDGWQPAVELPPLPPSSRPPRRRRAAIVAAGVVALLAVGATAVVVGLNSDSDSDSQLAVGDCVDLVAVENPRATDQAFAAEAERAGCDDPSASYEIAVLLADPAQPCPSEIYTTHVHEDAVRLCLTYNVVEGDCFVEAPPDSGPFDCALGPRPAAIKILRVVDGVADTDRCADLTDEGLVAVTVPQPPTTFCFTDFGARAGDTVRT